MAEEEKNIQRGAASAPAAAKEGTPSATNGAAQTVSRDLYGGPRRPPRGPRRGDRRDDRRDDMEQRILEVARVTRVMAGGKRMNFRACVALGDKKGQVGVGLGKGADVTMAVNKAVNRARKNLITVPIVNETIPHELYHKEGAAKIILKPAKKGRGVIAGGVSRVILELAGVKNVTSKALGSKNKINNARCTLAALKTLRRPEKSETRSGEAAIASKPSQAEVSRKENEKKSFRKKAEEK